MGDKLDSTIDAVASMSRNANFRSQEEQMKTEKTRRNSRSSSNATRKRKLEETDLLERPLELPSTSEEAWQEDSLINVTDDSKEDIFGDQPSMSVSQESEGPEEEDDDFKKDEFSMEEEVSTQIQPREVIERKFSTASSTHEPTETETDPMSIWKASDDIALITAIAHVSCLRYIYNTLSFSRNFSFHDLETRLHQLMYDEKWSPLAWKRMNEVPTRLRLHIEARTPFTREEERTLMVAADRLWKGKKSKGDSESHTILTIDHFKKILESHSPPFHKSRTPQVLSDHFRRIKGYREVPKDFEKYSYEALDGKMEGNSADVDIRVPLIASRARYHAISRYPLLRVLQNNFQTSASIPDAAVAIIHGRFLQYSMTGKQAVMGRQSMYDKVDIDLSKEGPAAKVSRQQAVITHVADNEFRIQNIGQRPMFVDSKPLPQGVGTSLKHGSIIEVAALRLIFSIPVPRELHPLIRNVAIQHLMPTQTGAPRGAGPPAAKKPRPGANNPGL